MTMIDLHDSETRFPGDDIIVTLSVKLSPFDKRIYSNAQTDTLSPFN